MIINFERLAVTPLRRKALLIAEAGYKAIDIQKTVGRKTKREKGNEEDFLTIQGQDKKLKIGLDNFKRVFLIGIGKGSALASATLAKILGQRLTNGIALDIVKLKTFEPRAIPRRVQNLKLEALVGTHPFPSIQNIKATQKIIELARGLTEKDLLIAFICGGGSALSCASKKESKQFILATKELTKAGADIVELNTVRKHLSDFKGGGLAKIAYPATVISLIVSDVLGNDLSMVASGPTVLDKTTKKDAIKILNKYLHQSVHKSALIRILAETPKNKKYFKKVKNILYVSNKDAVWGMREKVRQLKLKPKIHSLTLRGEAKKSLLPLIKKAKSGEVILAAGETTVTLRDLRYKIKGLRFGKGGRNQEAVLGALKSYFLNLKSDLVFVSFASDGRDNTEAAGAIGDYLVLEKAQRLKLNPENFLENHNSFNFFKETGDLIFTEPKSFNVADLMLVLSSPKE